MHLDLAGILHLFLDLLGEVPGKDDHLVLADLVGLHHHADLAAGLDGIGLLHAGDTVKFDQVLAIIDGENATFGTPVVEGASVEATVEKNGKGKKIRIFKYNPKKGYRKRQGHRQPYTKVEIGKISV